MAEQQTDLSFGTVNMPYNLEAEQSVLGAVLVEPSCISRVLEILRPEAFYRPQHQEIYTVMTQMFTTGQTMDFVTVLDQVKADRVFPSDQEAKAYFAQLMQIVPSVSNIEAYAKIVQEKYYIRSLISTAGEIIENSQDGQNDAQLLLDSAEQKIYEIRQGRSSQGMVPISEIIWETYDHLQKISGQDRTQFAGLSTGFTGLDQITTGLNKSDLLLVAGRPGMGKTAFMMNIACHVAMKQRQKVAVFNLEMSREQLVTRLLSSEASVGSKGLRTGEIRDDEWKRLAESAQMLARSPMYFDDNPSITVPEMKAKLRRIRDLGLVVIDYLQLMNSGRRIDNRVQEVSEITRSLKIMAKELNVPVILGSQLSRGPDQRLNDHRPVLSDLRESGSIEQDADLVLFLYRDAYYNKESDEHNIAECIVGKNRHGETDTVKLSWDGQFTRFGNLELFKEET